MAEPAKFRSALGSDAHRITVVANPDVSTLHVRAGTWSSLVAAELAEIEQRQARDVLAFQLLAADAGWLVQRAPEPRR